MKSKALLLMAFTPVYMLAVTAVALAVLYLNGFKLLDVQSDSMEPVISKGDMVLMNARETQFTPGQVIAYRSLIDEDVLITHRLVDEYQNGKLIATQGDALITSDPLIPVTQIEGSVIAVLPMLGRVTGPFKNTHATTITIYALAVVIIMQEIKRASKTLGGVNYHLNRYQRAM